MTVAWSTRFWTSAIVSSLLVLVWCSPAVIGSDRGRTAKCPIDLAGETQGCLSDYTTQLGASSDNRFFPGLDVEVIRSLCSLLDDSMRCVHNTLIENCPKSEQQQTIEDELGPHLGVRQLCLHTNIYEDYAMNQNCFVRIRPQAEICHQDFLRAAQDDEPNERPPSSLSSSPRHQGPQQRQYCNHVKRLISCVKSEVRMSTTSCQKMALRLVDVLVRASLPSTVNCRDEPNSTSSPTQGKASDQFQDVNSSGKSLQLGSGGLLLNVCCLALASLVCLQSFFLHAFGPSSATLQLHFRRPTPPTAALLSPSPPSYRIRLHHLHHRRFVDLLFS